MFWISTDKGELYILIIQITMNIYLKQSTKQK